jgi:hypothetical protein
MMQTHNSSSYTDTFYNSVRKSKMANTHREGGSTFNSKWVKVQAPDFKKIISREHLEKVHGDKRNIIPFSFPNFKWTRPSKCLINFNFIFNIIIL